MKYVLPLLMLLAFSAVRAEDYVVIPEGESNPDGKEPIELPQGVRFMDGNR